MQATFAEEVRRGLTSTPKQILPQYFYDALGSALFAAICELPEYYVTRTETEILHQYADDIATLFGSAARVVELGSGNGRKTQLLLGAILSKQRSLLYQPIDVDAHVLRAAARSLTAAFPTLTVDPVCDDYSAIARMSGTPRTVALFLGSSIGNLDHASAVALLRDIRSAADMLLIGFDLKKPKDLLEPAYDDSLGVTAAFNLNLLARINRELAGTFDVAKFAHRAFYDDAKGRVEMHLVSRAEQTVRIGALDLDVTFADGETIHTENSYKYDFDEIEALAAAADFKVAERWLDSRRWFADVLFRG